MAVSSEKKSIVNYNGLKVEFSEAGHVYKVFDGDQRLKYKPISVTTLIHKYQKPFDLEGMSALCAKREGVTQEEMKKRWANISKTACNHGIKMHTVAERIFNGEFVDDSTFTDDQKVVFQQIIAVVSKMKERPYDFESEKIIFDPGINVAGTVDLIGKHRQTGEYLLVDWKTNKRIRKDNEWGQMFLSPVDDLPDCEFTTYGLQLSMYERILKKGGYIEPDAKVRKFICHFHPVDGCQFHEVDSTFLSPAERICTDWVKRNEAKAKLNADIPQF